MKENQSCIKTFLILISCCILNFACKGAYPFGDKSIMVCDGIHQYIAFYEELWTIITGQNSAIRLFYTDFYGLFAYYLASPFTLLVLMLRFFVNINEAVSAVVVVKIGLAGAAFAWYQEKRNTLCKEWIISLSCMYALSDYVLGYYTNLMWLDAVILLPILVYYIEVFVNNGKGRGYCFTLLFSIIINYYTGYMLGIFSVLYFLSLAIREKRFRQVYMQFMLKTAGCMEDAKKEIERMNGDTNQMQFRVV